MDMSAGAAAVMAPSADPPGGRWYQAPPNPAETSPMGDERGPSDTPGSGSAGSEDGSSTAAASVASEMFFAPLADAGRARYASQAMQAYGAAASSDGEF